MTIAANRRSGKKTLLRSWKSPSDPSSLRIFIGVPIMSSTYLDGFSLADDRNGGFTLSFGFSDDSFITNFVLSSEGKFGQVYLDDTTEGSWGYEWENDQDECEFYGKCGGISCMLWRGNLTDIKLFSSGGADLYIRLAYTELDNKKKNLKVIISLTVVGGAIAIAISVFYSWRWIAEYKGKLLISISLVDFF
ncbi:hypothetical protein OIU76_026093 [Salix suchowensis]|nr:hypothetical protein OIU76_026093 [Salix suchowensis]